MKRDKMAEVLAVGINLLNGRESCHVTITQVESIAQMYRDVTKESAFSYPDYTLEVYLGGKDGWKLHRYPNKAGLLTRVKHSEVVENQTKRELERKQEEICKDINEKFMNAINSGKNPMEDTEYLNAVNDYREWCKTNG